MEEAKRVDRHLIKDLQRKGNCEISMLGSNILLTLDSEKELLHFSTPVYWGGNYLPKSVRDCLGKKAPFDSGEFYTSFFVNEEHYEIFFQAKIYFEEERLFSAIEEFASLACEWKEWLDQHDRHDLVYAYRSR